RRPAAEAFPGARRGGGAGRLPLPRRGAGHRRRGHHYRHGVALVSAGAAPARPARQRSGPRLAFWLESTSLAACEIAASLGYDAVIFDIEHGVLPMEACDYLTLCCKRLGLTVYSRVAAADRVAIQHALDAGADGVVLPQITDLAHARAATAFAKYPPLGS